MQFKDFPIVPAIVDALTHENIVHPTEIQQKIIPILLKHEMTDIHGQAQTGTGKTLAFGIPLVQRIHKESSNVQGLVIAPTRELALQIAQSLRIIAQPLQISIAAVYGGMPLRDQIRILKKGVHIVIGTPGRLNDHLKRGTLQLNALQTLVLDEADIMLDMGFKEEIDEILQHIPQKRQIWLFSATIKACIYDLIKKYMPHAITVKATTEEKNTHLVAQYFSISSLKDRMVALTRFIDFTPHFYGFVFCQTKALTEEVAEYLMAAGYPAHALHGDMTQIQRNRIIRQFKGKDFTILVATDVAARGIDIANLTHVINYSLPEDQESYIHRIGRTGRAGKEGTAITLIDRMEIRFIRMLERKFHISIKPLDVPTLEEIAKTNITQIAQYLNSVQQGNASPQFPELMNLINEYDKETVSQAIIGLLQEKFFRKKRKDDTIHFPSIHSVDLETHGQSEVVLNQGLADGITKEDINIFLKKHITDFNILSFPVRVINRRSFIKLSADDASRVMQQLRGKKLNGKPLKVSVSVDYGYRAGNRYENKRRPHTGKMRPRMRDQGSSRSSRSWVS